MIVHDIVFCVKTINTGDGITANSILSVLNPEYIPGLFSFSVIITILGIDTSKHHELSLKLVSPSLEEIVDLSLDMPLINDIDMNLPEEYRGINMAMDWNNVNFKSSGVYSLTVAVDGYNIGRKEIFVKGKNE